MVSSQTLLVFRQFPGCQVYTDKAHEKIRDHAKDQTHDGNNNDSHHSEPEMALIIEVGPPSLPAGKLPGIGDDDQGRRLLAGRHAAVAVEVHGGPRRQALDALDVQPRVGAGPASLAAMIGPVSTIAARMIYGLAVERAARHAVCNGLQEAPGVRPLVRTATAAADSSGDRGLVLQELNARGLRPNLSREAVHR